MHSTSTALPLPASPSVPCPSWCTHPAGHGLEPERCRGTWRRLHLGPVGSDGAGLGVQRFQVEVVAPDGQLWRERVQVVTWDEHAEELIGTAA